MNRLIASVLLFTGTLALADDAADRASVLQTIDSFFAAMSDRDVDRMRTLMTPDGIIYGYRETADGLQITQRTHATYLDGLGKGQGRLLERFWDPQVIVDGRLATVWTPYDFHIDGNFSHCGINNFSMLRTDAGWVIAGVVFSIRVTDCGVSPLGPVGE